MKSNWSRIKYQHLFFVSLSLLINACTDSNTSYFPLTEGYSWRYHRQVTSMGGTEQQKYYFSSLPTQTIDGKNTYIHRSLTGTQVLYRNIDGAIVRIGFRVPDGASFKQIADEHLVLPANPKAGSEWNSIIITQTLTTGRPSEKSGVQVQAEIPVINKIESETETVKVSAGEFRNCLRVHTSGFAFNKQDNYIGRSLVEIEQTNWYAPGVGLVKSVLVETTSSDSLNRGELVMELESFEQP